MLTMGNGCGVLGDVSYMASDSSGYTLPFYWRMTFWGELGVIDTSKTSSEVTVALNGENGIRHEPLSAGKPGGYFRSFIHDIEGNLDQDELCTEYSLRVARMALTIQKAADTHL